MFTFNCGGHLDIGGYSTTKSEVFFGFINFIAIYDSALDKKAVKYLKDPKKRPLNKGSGGSGGAGDSDEASEEGGGSGGALPTSGPLMTQDGRDCVGVCTTNKLPGMPGAPDPPKEAALG